MLGQLQPRGGCRMGALMLPDGPQLQSPAVRKETHGTGGKRGIRWQKGNHQEGNHQEGEPSGGPPEQCPRCGEAVVSLCKATAATARLTPLPRRHRGTAAAREKNLRFMNCYRVVF